MRRLIVFICSILTYSIISNFCNAQADSKKNSTGNEATTQLNNRVLGKSRTFIFSYAGAVQGLSSGEEARVWLPVPPKTIEQDVEVISRKLPADGSVYVEKQYGNRMLYFKAQADAKGTVPFEVGFRVTRREVTTDFKANVTLAARPTDSVSRFLQADHLVPVGGRPLELLKRQNATR